jgi:hypothetical protein
MSSLVTMLNGLLSEWNENDLDIARGFFGGMTHAGCDIC